MAKPKNGVQAMKYRMVVLMDENEVKEYDEMMDAIGENRSEHIRNIMKNEVAIWKDAKS